MSFLGNCPICLSDYKEPYSIPCGHLFCLDCLVEYISYSSRDSLTAKCPSCRDEFPLVNPELRFLPKRFHRYMIPSIRPLFIGTSPSESEGLVQKVEALEARIDILKIEKYELRRSWEKVKADAARHARGESAAKNEVERLENETTRLRELLGEALIEARLARAYLPPSSDATSVGGAHLVRSSSDMGFIDLSRWIFKIFPFFLLFCLLR